MPSAATNHSRARPAVMRQCLEATVVVSPRGATGTGAAGPPGLCRELTGVSAAQAAIEARTGSMRRRRGHHPGRADQIVRARPGR